MADKRECFAGDLTSDAIGKTIVVPANGLNAATEGVLVEVTHFVGMTSRPVTQVVFDDERVLSIDHTVTVEVRS